MAFNTNNIWTASYLYMHATYTSSVIITAILDTICVNIVCDSNFHVLQKSELCFTLIEGERMDHLNIYPRMCTLS